MLVNDGVQNHRARDMRDPGSLRILRRDLVGDSTRHDVAADAQRRRWLWRRGRQTSRRASNDAAQNTGCRTSRNASLNASGDSHVRRRRFLVNHGNLLGDDGRSNHLLLEFRLWFHFHNRGWRRRWWGRRRSCQKRSGEQRWKSAGVNQRDENQNDQDECLNARGNPYAPNLSGRFFVCGLHKLIKHWSYLLAVARRFSARLSAEEGIEMVAPRWPRHLFQTTTIGAAMPKLEYVPTTTPMTIAKAKLRSTCPPKMKSRNTVRKVSPLVRMVRESVWLMERLTMAGSGSRRISRRFSRTRSKITMVSFIE